MPEALFLEQDINIVNTVTLQSVLFIYRNDTKYYITKQVPNKQMQTMEQQ